MDFDETRLQWCWSHIKLDLQKLIDKQDFRSRRLRYDLACRVRPLFEHWHSYESEHLSWRVFKRRIMPVRKESN
jgi:hypothetical protein